MELWNPKIKTMEKHVRYRQIYKKFYTIPIPIIQLSRLNPDRNGRASWVQRSESEACKNLSLTL